ncbi:hypothetical protein GIB67_018710 [Kingdonia uniflora]|uniref:Uncharacterized protein n=1 Tax=Kingdonia uniflora TaxID=39325 RepID=A0A7J7L2B9_9MAGN|nr:hypothetical protein GIB67_018710 [Kingdonia uniflora]
MIDDDAEVLNNLAMSKFPSKSGLNEKIEFLERAEENYYGNKVSSKQNSNLNKKSISEALREAGKQRLLTSIKQTLQRLCNLNIDIEASATMLEGECYKKYGKIGKTFYNSQLASTVRWLSTLNSTEIMDRLGTHANAIQDETASCIPDSQLVASLTSEDCKNQARDTAAEIGEETCCSVISGTSSSAAQNKATSKGMIELLPIPSFSEFVSKKGKEGLSRLPPISSKRSSTEVHGDVEKKVRQK